jgi:hypothetical protein
MPRGPNKKETGREPTQNEAQGAPPEIPTFKMWFEDAWHGWLKPVGGIVAIVGLYFAYMERETLGVPERAFGVLALVAIVGGALYAGSEGAFERLTTPKARYGLIGFMVVWAAAAAWAPLRTALPGATIGETHVAFDKDHLSATVKLPEGDSGPYEIAVGGILKGQGEAESNYTLTFAGSDGSSEEINGSIKRTFMRQRVSRRGTGSVAVRTERNENAHRLTKAHGPQLTITADGADEALEDGLFVTFHRGGPSPLLLFVLGALCAIVGIVLDYKLLQPKKQRTHFAAATGFTLAFALLYPMEATPHWLVPPAVAELVRSLFVGALPAWVISIVANSFKPKPKKLAGVKA